MIIVPGKTATQVSEERHAELAARVRADRDDRIAAVEWRVSRYRREADLGLPHADDLTALNLYIQALCDVPQKAGFPKEITWPKTP